MRIVFLVLLACSFFFSFPQFAAERNHYPLGFNGINAAIRPENSVLNVPFVNFYNANRITGPIGKGLHGHFDEVLFIEVLHWYTDFPFLGGTYGTTLIIPTLSFESRFRSPTTSIRAGGNAFLLGDIYFEPFNVNYRFKYLQIYWNYGIYMPTGKFQGLTPSYGLGCWGHELLLAMTYFFDKKKTFSASFFATYEIHSKLRGLNYYPGDNLCIDWGVGKQLGKTWTVGVAGYAEWQTTKDTGRDVPPGIDGGIDRVYAIGPELIFALPEKKCFWGNVSFSGNINGRYLVEFCAFNRTEGQAKILEGIFIFSY